MSARILAFKGLVSSEGERGGKTAALTGELCTLSEEARGLCGGRSHRPAPQGWTMGCCVSVLRDEQGCHL